jgi:alkyl hydroperoxide reductase subunit AhpF
MRKNRDYRRFGSYRQRQGEGVTFCPHCHASIADEKIVAHAKIRARNEMIHTALDSLKSTTDCRKRWTTIARELQTHS